MLFGSKLGIFTGAAALALGVGAFVVVAPAAQAQTVTDCDPSNPDPDNFGGPNDGICANGLGASFAFQFFNQAVTGGNAVNSDGQPTVDGAFDGLYNYGSRGSSAGIEGLRRGNCFDSDNSPAVPEPCSFFFSEAPLNDDDLFSLEDGYYTLNLAEGFVGAGQQGLGAPVQVPAVAGLVTISVDNTPGVTDDTELTAEQVCALFNGTPDAVAGIPAALAGAQGAHRDDGSGTSFIFTNALQAQCNDFGPRDVNGDGTVSPNEDLWSYEFNGQFFDRGAGEDPAKVSNGNPFPVTGTTFDVCGANGAPDNTTCWDDDFAFGDGNDGVADAVQGDGQDGAFLDDVPRFGYVELAETRVPGRTLELPSVVNRLSGESEEPTPENGTQALNASNVVFGDPVNGNVFGNTNPPGVAPNQCQLTANRFDPSEGWPYVGVSYALFFGDYSPTAAEANALVPGSGGGVNEAIFLLQGSVLRNRFLSLFTNAQLQSAAANAFYVPIQDVTVPNDLGDLALETFLSCTEG